MLLCPWDFPGKNTGMGFCFLLQRVLPDQGIDSMFPAFQADSLLCGPPENLHAKPKIIREVVLTSSS